ncbi:PREDICTED: dehydrogenase/reductase SDR family member 11-like [Wasmannia auropunctata]|uniref:dehydrogenase/reductase SDR family member 11-like n=1 Tax=Wasmannia auropunctata TaxID=64793 RepID=UPI0005EE544C|nr:PREDICTED: dehydrogenase/reductase SDR family member 11-like [Wasmannia auropunctata]
MLYLQIIMLRWRGKIAVVTGAASGIGEAITRGLLQNGVNVVALDIQKERLAKLNAECKQEGSRTLGTLYTICCDINSEDDIKKAFSEVETLGGVDIMVNNAGIIKRSRIIDSKGKTYEKLLDTNVLAVAVCTNKAVSSMRKRNGEGHIFTITRYCYRHLLVWFFQTISPGSVKTNIFEHSDAMRDFFEKTGEILQPSDIADAIIYALGTRPEVQVTHVTIQPTGESHH